MAWEWCDNLKELTGHPGIISGEHTWDWILEQANTSGINYLPSDTGDFLQAGEGEYYFGGGEDQHYITTYGLTLNWEDSRLGSGGFDFVTNVPVPNTQNYYGYSLGGLLYKGTFRILINREEEEAVILLVRCFQNGPYYTTYDWMGQSVNHTIRNIIYNFVMANITSPITWSTVSSVTGKNGKCTLTKILNINDGEPVDNITNKGNLDFSKKTKVNTLVSNSFVPEHREDATKALAKYEVQNKVYSYCTLVYKKGEIPNDVADGTAIQIDPDGEEVAITGLEENKTYYFVIFTNKTTSEPYRFRTGHNAPEEGIFKLKVTVDKALLDNGFKDFASYEKVT